MSIINPNDLNNFIKSTLMPNVQVNTPETLFQDILQAVHAQNYTAALQTALCYRDEQYGIHSSYQNYTDPHGTTFPVLIRDARESNGKHLDDYDPRALMILIINYTRATQKLLDISGITMPQFKNELSVVLAASLKDIKSKPEEAKKELTRLSNYLIELLAQELNITKEDAKKRLNVAKDFVNLEEPAHSIATLSLTPTVNHKVETFLELDVPLCELTDELKDEYIHRASQGWYQDMPEWQQKLIDAYADSIQSGTRILPTQLRRCLPGIRNAYLTHYGVWDENNKYQQLGENFNCATLLFKSKNTASNESIIAKNINQLLTHMQKFHPQTKKLFYTSLNSQYVSYAGEHSIVTKTKMALEKLGHSSANLCISIFRVATPNHYGGINEQLAEVFSHPLLRNNLPEIKRIKSYINHKRKRSNELELYQKAIDKLYLHKESYDAININLFPLLQTALRLRYLIQIDTAGKDPENRSLEMAVHTIRVNQYLHALNNHRLATSLIANGCQSNKDRGGLLRFALKHDALRNYLINNKKIPLSTDLNNNVLTVLANAGHEAIKAGDLGGTLGAFGIKKSTEHAVPESYPETVKKKLLHKEASLNSKILHAIPKSGNEDELTINILAGLRHRISRTRSKYDFKNSGWLHTIWHYLFSSKTLSKKRVEVMEKTLNDIDQQISANPNDAYNIISDNLLKLSETNKGLSKQELGLFSIFHKKGGTQKFIDNSLYGIGELQRRNASNSNPH